MNILKNTKLVFIAFLFINLTACELIPPKSTTIPTYGDYYLWLKTLNNDELLQEIEQQRKNKKVKSPDADIYVMLLHSLPKSPIYNPYTAKSILNELQLQYVESRYNPTNLALITLLRDLLNEQLLTIQKQNRVTVQYRNTQNMLLTLQQKSAEKDKKLTIKHKEALALKQKVALLEEQINQLHRIEKNIDEHGK